MRTTPIWLAVGAVFLNCATLNPVSANTCGNGVVEANEDCDVAAKTCGAPTADAAHACHAICNFETDPTKAIACAPGASCGADGVCRTPAGTFASVLPGVSTNVSTLLAGDFDGDRHTDLIGSPPYGSAGSSRVHYFDTNSGLATTTPLDQPLQLGVVKDLDGDSIDDLGFAIRTLGFGAFGALRGQKDRTFATVLFPALTFPSTDARWTVVTEGPHVILPGTTTACAFGIINGITDPTSKATTNRIGSVCDGSTGAAGAYSLILTTNDLLPTNMVGDPAAAALDSAHPIGCGDLVFATQTGVYLLSPCVPAGDAWDANAKLRSIPFAGGTPSITGLYVGPIRQTDADDILVQTATAVFIYDKKLLQFAVAVDPLVSQTTLPLATGDLNGDGTIDYVYPTGISITKGIPLTTADAGLGLGGGGSGDDEPDAGTRVAPRDNLTWASAKIGRFNDDDFPDVLVSFTDNQLDVDVLGNSGDGRFTPFTVRTDEFVRGIGAGDFDGDRIDDVAFLQSSNPDPTSEASPDLYIAFGSPTGSPSTAQLVGTLKSGHSLLSLRDSSIGVDDLSVTSSTPEPANNAQGFTGNESQVTVLFGSGSRTQVAPLFMLDPTDSSGAGSQGAGGSNATAGGLPQAKNTSDTAHYWQPISFSIGPFVNPGPNQIVSLATGVTVNPTAPKPADRLKTDDTAAWFAGHDDSAVGGLDPFVKAPQPIDEFVGFDGTAIEDGQFELAMVTASGDIDYPVAANQEVDELVTITETILDRSTLAVYVVRPGQNTTTVLAARIPNASVAGSDPVQIIDLTGDHKPDIAFIVTADKVRKLMIMRGDGTGNFDQPVAVAVPTDAETFAPINTGGAHLELAVVTPTKLVLASLDGVTDISPAVTAPSYTGVAAGDFNGDGVQDIAIADSGSIRLLPQNHVVH